MTNGKPLENAKQHANFEDATRLELLVNARPNRPGVCLGIPTTGIIRFEWHHAFTGIIIPTNWEWSSVVQGMISTLGYTVAQARNLIVQSFLASGRQWLFFLDHDVICPPNSFIWMDQHIRKPRSPVIGGLYYTKGSPSEPLIYRGRGNGSYQNFKLGDKVWCDGMGMGFTIIHRSVLQYLYDHSPVLDVSGVKVRHVFSTPRQTFMDPESGLWARTVGTEDMYFLDRIREEKVLEKFPQWEHLAGRKYPFLVDTRMFCQHIELNGTTYPLEREQLPGFPEWQQMMASRKWAARD